MANNYGQTQQPYAKSNKSVPGVRQQSEFGDDNNPDGGGSNPFRRKKQVEVTISAKNLRWKNLERYLKLEFPDMVVRDSQKTVLNESFIVVLPRRLLTEELQDIDILRGKQIDVDEFLDELEEEKNQESGMSMADMAAVLEDEDDEPPTSPGSRAGGRRGGGFGTNQLRSVNRGRGRDRG